MERPKSPMLSGNRPERDITPDDVRTSVEVVRSLAARVMRGEKKAPPLELYEAIQALMPQPAVEVLLTDGKGKYALQRRPEGDKHFGSHKLHLLGGFLKPDRRGISMVEAAKEMAETEMGAKEVEYVAGPIATYQWTRGSEHPTGWPSAQVYVMKVEELPEREDIVWLSNDEVPAKDDMIIGKAGDIHLDYLRVYRDWCKDPNQPCRDLNEKPFDAGEE